MTVHAFPPYEVLQDFIGKELTQVGLDPWQLQFHFEDGASIVVAEALEHIGADGVSDRLQDGENRDVAPFGFESF